MLLSFLSITLHSPVVVEMPSVSLFPPVAQAASKQKQIVVMVATGTANEIAGLSDISHRPENAHAITQTDFE